VALLLVSYLSSVYVYLLVVSVVHICSTLSVVHSCSMSSVVGMYIGKGGGGLLIVSRCIVGCCQGVLRNIFLFFWDGLQDAIYSMYYPTFQADSSQFIVAR
jgi:hypothetical protein